MSHFLLPLLFLVSLLFCSLCPIISGLGANVTLYTDSYCKNPSGPAAHLPMPFSSLCHDLKTTPPSSLIFDCVSTNRGKYTNFTFLWYDGVNDCCGIISSGIQSNDYTSSCANTLLTYMGSQSKIWSRITCDVAWDQQYQSTIKGLDKTEVAKETAKTMINIMKEMNMNNNNNNNNNNIPDIKMTR